MSSGSKRTNLGLIYIILLLGYSVNIHGVEDQLLKDCLETVKDVDKCNALVNKNKVRNQSNQNKPESIPDEGSSLKIRKKIKNDLQGKNKLYVIKYLGEPDERLNSAEYEYFVYKKPKSRYSEDSPVDLEIKVVFRRGHVSEVIHTPPPGK